MTSDQLEQFFTNRNYDYSQWEEEITEYTVDDVDEQLLIEYVNKGNDCGRINFSDMKQFRGNIFECIDEAVRYVTNNIRWRAEIVRMERVETPEIPIEAFREIIVNSFAHMKVNSTSSNEIYITPSKVHIYNPGPLVPGTDPEMFASGEQGSMIRNPLIATVLYYSRTIDAFGTGFERVFRLCKDIRYQYSNNQFGFTFEFLRDHFDTINESYPYGEEIHKAGICKRYREVSHNCSSSSCME